MRHSESLANISPALVKARSAIKAVHKDASNPFFGSRYVTLGGLMDAALPALLANGITVIQGGGLSDDAGAEVVTRLQHESGEWLETVLRMPLCGMVKKDGTVLPINSQSAGAAQSYGQRYGLAGILGIVADDDDDGEKASGGEARSDAKPAARPAAKPAAKATPTVKAPVGDPAGIPNCPKCGGTMWDNREGKTNPKAPDYKCKDKQCVDEKGYVTALWERDVVTAGFDQMPDALQGDDGPPEWL